jgi:hypothetical protein
VGPAGHPGLPRRHAIRELIIALRNHDNEFDIQRLLGLMKVVTS